MPKPTVHLVPTGTHYIVGVPAVEQDVDRDTADRLLAYSPPAFIEIGEPPPPATAADTTAPEDPGLSDSTEG